MKEFGKKYLTGRVDPRETPKRAQDAVRRGKTAQDAVRRGKTAQDAVRRRRVAPKPKLII